MIYDSITPITDDVPQRWASFLWHATELGLIKAGLPKWRKIADDAIALVETWTVEDFIEWRRGLRLEHRKQFAGEEWAGRFAAVLMPGRMFQASVVAEHFKVPWGLAWQRLIQTDAWWDA